MIPLFKPYMSPSARRNVERVLEEDPAGRIYIGQGPMVEEFETKLQSVLSLPTRPLATSSCTAALDLALHLAGATGDVAEVISTPMTCSATNTVIVNRGVRIVWADVDPVTGLIDPDDVARKVTPFTKAIVAVDWGGRLCNFARLKTHGIPVIEDAAHAFLAYRGLIGEPNAGDYVCWSFQAIKHVTCGDGGALLVPPAQYERAKKLRWYGLDRTLPGFRAGQIIEEAGYKYNMNDIAAAIGLGNLKHAHRIVSAHARNAEALADHLGSICEEGTVLPPRDDGSAWWLYTMHVHPDHRDAFIDDLRRRGVEAGRVHGRCDTSPGIPGTYANELLGVTRFDQCNVSIPVGWWVEDAGVVGRAVLATLRDLRCRTAPV